MDPVAFNLFGIDIMWYGIIIMVGVLLGTLVAIRNGKRDGVSEDTIIDLLLFAVPIAFVSARIYYVAFSWDRYSENLMDIFNVRQGGLAIHGGLIGAVVTAIIYCKVKRVEFWKLADVMAPGIILGQAIGRWGNYINQEAYGRPTDLPWAIMIDGVSVHPTFLYESIWNLIVFVGLMIYRDRGKSFEGEVFLLYVLLYSIGRFFIEGLRTDSLMIGELRMAQLISLLIIGVSLAIIYAKKKSLDKI